MAIPEKILFVDDEQDILHSFQRQFRKKASIKTATSGKEGLELIKSEEEFAIVVSDMRMPEMDGAEFLRKVKSESPNTIRILLTGQTDLNSAISAVNEGQIFRFLTKPCPQEVLQETLKNAIRQYRLINTEKELLQNTVKGCVELLTELLGTVKPQIFSNFNRIKGYINHISTTLDIPDIWDFEVAAMLYSLGFLTLPNELANRALDPQQEFSASEKMLLQEIPLVSSQLIKHIPRLENIAEMVRLSAKVQHLNRKDAGAEEGRILLGAAMLKSCLAFDKLLEIGHNVSSATELLLSKEDHDPELIEALKSLNLGGDENCSTIEADKLLAGMVLLEPLRTDCNTVLLAKGTELTEELLTRIQLYTKNQGISRPVKIVR